MPSGSPVVFRYAAILFVSLVMTACAGMRNDPVSPEQPKQQTVTIAVSPTSATVTVSKTQQFQVTLGGTKNTSVTWAVDGIAGGNPAAGSISSTGLYTAPSTAGSHTVTVTSAADTTKSANASVAVNPIPPPPPPNTVSVLSARYDLGRTGENLAETILKPSNVNSSNFGAIASFSVDGVVYAQPLYVSNLSIAGGKHNVVLVATEHDSVYAFDADATNPIVYWQRRFIDPTDGITTVPTSDVGSTIFPEIGITGTPVIDPNSHVMYFVVYTKENGQYFHRLHAVDITTGQDANGGVALIQGSVPGTSTWNNDGNGNIVFTSEYQLQRPGLLLLNGVVYIAFGSHGDNNQYHGWVMAYDAATLQQLGIWNTTANGNAGAIWQGGTGLAADSNGNIYVTTANGDFGLSFGGPNASDSVLKLNFNRSASDPTKAFTIADYFTPDDQLTLAADDNDLGSSGLMLIPGTHRGIVAGKEGSIYVLDLGSLGHYNPNSNNVVQFLPGLLGTNSNGADENFSTASYFNGNVYYIGENDTIKQFAFDGNQLSNAPIDISGDSYGELGAQAVISADGTSNAILWAIEYVAGGTSGELRAYNANDVSQELYTTSLAPFGGAVKFSVPTVANGKVYIGTQSKLVVFGNL